MLPKERFGKRILNLLLDKIPFDSNFLELGTGSGRLLEYLLRNGFRAKVYGVDICKELLISGKRKYTKDVNLVLADAKRLPFKDASFHSVACRGLLHHLVGRSPERNVMQALKEAARVLNDEGIIFIDEECWKYKIQSRILFLILYILARLNISIPYFEIHARIVVYFLTPDELHSLLVNSGFKVLEWMKKESSPRLIRYKLTLLETKYIYIRLTATKMPSRSRIRMQSV